jgi:methyltransferase
MVAASIVNGRAFYYAFLAFLALERVAELVLSRRNARRAFARGGVEVGQRHYRVMAIFHTLFLVACAVEPLALPHAYPPALGVVALAGAIAAQALRYWAIATLGERWNVRIIVLPGAAPVVAGPYRWVRHPNYVAVVAELLSVPLIHGAFVTAIAFSLGNALLLLVRIRAEEAALGPRYADAFAATPRFVPGGKS